VATELEAGWWEVGSGDGDGDGDGERGSEERGSEELDGVFAYGQKYGSFCSFIVMRIG
jgi:hypothetical protein